MNQQKTGEFLKRLRREKGLTQEQLAERFYVSSRTVSRWETGSNLPDVGMLIDLADFYEVDIREIIDGERKSEMMNKETKDTLKKVATYVAEKEKRKKGHTVQFALGIVAVSILVMLPFALESNEMQYDFFNAVGILLAICALVGGSFSVLYAWVSAFQEEPTNEPERTVFATMVFKEVREGTNRSGRSMMGYSFVVNFRTEDRELLELYAYEIEFGGLKEGMTGILTYKGRYFVRFQETA